MENFNSIIKDYAEGEYENSLISFMENFSDKIKVPNLSAINEKMQVKFGVNSIKIVKNEIEDKGLLHSFAMLSNENYNEEITLGLLYYLGKIKHIKSKNILELKLKDSNEKIVIQALYSLGCLGYKESSNKIIDVLESTSSNKIKGEAIWGLGKIGDNNAIDKILKYLEVEELRYITISSLGKSRNKNYSDKIRPFLKSSNEQDLIRTVIALARLKDTKSIPDLLNILDGEISENLATSVIYTLGELQAKEAVPYLISYLRKEEIPEDVIVKTLLKIGRLATDLLIDALQDDDLYIKTCAAKLLGDIGDRKAVSSLVATLQDDDIFVVDEVITSLGKIGDETAIARLIDIYKQDNDYIKNRVKAAIFNIGDTKAFSVLINNIDDEKNKIDEIMELFDEMGSHKTSILIDSLKDKDKYVRISAINALKHLQASEIETIIADVIKDEDYNVRQIIVKTIGELKLVAAKNYLIDALKIEKNQDVIIELVWSLGEINATESIDLLFSILENETYDTILRLRTADSIVKFGDISTSKIFVMTTSKDEFTREASAYMLGKIGNKNSIEVIKNMLNDDTSSVVSMAVNALANLKDITSFDMILSNFNIKKIKEDALANFIQKVGEELIPLIPNMIKTKNPSSPIVIRQLGYIDSDNIKELLIQISKELAEDPYILKATILALSIHGKQKELDIIMQYIFDPNVEISSTAIMSMDKIQKRLNN